MRDVVAAEEIMANRENLKLAALIIGHGRLWADPTAQRGPA
jgi:hypothetical protein